MNRRRKGLPYILGYYVIAPLLALTVVALCVAAIVVAARWALGL